MSPLYTGQSFRKMSSHSREEIRLSKAQRLHNVRYSKGIFNGDDRATGGAVEELVDSSDTHAIEQHGDSLADGLDSARLSALFEETELVLCKGYAEGILELQTVR